MNRTLSLLTLLLLLGNNLLGQYSLTGKVIDQDSRAPLAFVNIIFNENPQSGVVTDIDGAFVFNSSSPPRTLTCSYVGYDKTTIALDTLPQNRELIISLKPSALQLREVVIVAGENPANRIIRKVIENKTINNPEKISSFQYNSYNKVVYDMMSSNGTDSDSFSLQLNQFLKGGHMLIMESVTERKFIQPDLDNETILGNKVSGFKSPSFAPLATDIQPFSFYKEIITIFDANYLNPISNGSLKKYNFRLEDTLYQQRDTVFILSFEPKKDKNFEGLTGLLYINTHNYAIQNVIAEPFQKGTVDIRIQQKYQLINERQWFPEQLNFELMVGSIDTTNTNDIRVTANGRSYIHNIELLPELRKRDFSPVSLKIQTLAAEKDSLFWRESRTESLNQREITTYQVLDSLGNELKFDQKLALIEKVSLGRVPIKFLDIDLKNSLVFNPFEGFRPGTGLYTNEKLWKAFSVGGFFGYGLKDHLWKYGGEFILTIDKERELEFRGKHQYSLAEAGISDWNFFNNSLYNSRNLVATRMDRIQQNSLTLRFRAFKYAQLGLNLNHTQTVPLYDYEFKTETSENISSYTNSDLNIRLRFAFREKRINSFGQTLSMGSKYPVIQIHFSKGIKGLYGSQFNYNKIEARIEQSFLSKNLGETKITLDGGYVDKSLPYGLLFSGEGSFVKGMPLIIEQYFQTAAPFEYLSDRYLNFFFSHNFGALLFQRGNFKPHISLHHNMGWGTLKNQADHKIIDFKTKDQGFLESGLQLDNLFKLNYLNVAYLGLGGGVFYRYGPYAHDEIKDNLVFKLSIIATTK